MPKFTLEAMGSWVGKVINRQVFGAYWVRGEGKFYMFVDGHKDREWE